MKPKINFKEFYENYGNEWSIGKRKDCEFLSSQWKTEKIIQLLKKNKNIQINSILDYGTGPANILRNISKELKIDKCYGIDISSSMIGLAKKNFPQADYFILDDLSKFNKEVDAIMFLDVLEHVPDPKGLLNRARKISKYIIIKIPLEDTPKKRILSIRENNIVHPEGHINFWNKKNFFMMLKQYDFEIIDYWEGNLPKNILFYFGNIKSDVKGIKKKVYSLYNSFRKNIFSYPRLYSLLFGSNLFIIIQNKNSN